MVLAYSGGLDTSVILKWLQETYECEVVTFTADLGQVRAYRDFQMLCAVLLAKQTGHAYLFQCSFCCSELF